MEDQKKIFYKAGAYIYIEGDEDIDSVYIVESGEIEFRLSNQYIDLPKSSAYAGDIFGFISSLSGRPRIETAVAKTDSTVISLTCEKFLTLLQKNSEIAMKIIDYFADELRAFDNMIFTVAGEDKGYLDKIDMISLAEYFINSGNTNHAYYVLLRYIQLSPDKQKLERARELIQELERSGIRSLTEPIKESIYDLYADKQIIFCEGEPGSELFIIKEGRVEILKYKHNTEITLSVLKEGDIFGELAIVSDKPRNATAVALGKTVVLPINRESLLLLLDKSPGILKRIFTAISQRVWFTFIRLESRIYKKIITRLYSFIENKLLEDNISLKSNTPHTLSFGIDELLKMNNVDQEENRKSIEKLFEDQNLEFHFGRILINNPSEVAAQARYYKTRDNISDIEE